MSQYYVGTKIVQAAYEERLHDVVGYKVIYEDGYESWSPKDVFEQAYLPLGDIGRHPAHVQRLIGEYAQVKARIAEMNALDGECATFTTHTPAAEVHHRALISLERALKLRLEGYNAL